MIAYVGLDIHINPKCHRPPRRVHLRRPRVPLPDKVLRKNIARRVVQRCILAWRYPDITQRWVVSAEREPLYRTRGANAPWTKDETREFWQQECPYRTEFVFPSIQEIDTEPLLSLEPKLKGYSLDAIKRGFYALIENRQWPTILAGRVVSPRRVLPKEWEIKADDYMVATNSTHYLCYGGPPAHPCARPRTASVTRRDFFIVPVDAMALVLHCRNLPPIPSSHPKITFLGEEAVPVNQEENQPSGNKRDDIGLKGFPVDTTHESDKILKKFFMLRLPTLFLTVPDPSTMPILLEAFAHGASAFMIMALLNVYPSDPCRPRRVTEAPIHIPCMFQPFELAERLRACKGLMMNMAALGVSDAKMWKSVRGACITLLNARQRQVEGSFEVCPHSDLGFFVARSDKSQQQAKIKIFSSPLG